MSSDEQAKLVTTLCNKMAPILAGHPPQVQSAALADLTATWLCGHKLENATDDEIAELRYQLMRNFVDLVGQMSMLNDAMGERKKRMQ